MGPNKVSWTKFELEEDDLNTTFSLKYLSDPLLTVQSTNVHTTTHMTTTKTNFSDPQQIITKKYVDDNAATGAGDL